MPIHTIRVLLQTGVHTTSHRNPNSNSHAFIFQFSTLPVPIPISNMPIGQNSCDIIIYLNRSNFLTAFVRSFVHTRQIDKSFKKYNKTSSIYATFSIHSAAWPFSLLPSLHVTEETLVLLSRGCVVHFCLSQSALSLSPPPLSLSLTRKPNIQ